MILTKIYSNMINSTDLYVIANEKIDAIKLRLQSFADLLKMSCEQKTKLDNMMEEIRLRLSIVKLKIMESDEFDGEVDIETRTIISIRKKLIDDENFKRIKTVLFHELVHAAGGHELDCEILEFVYCTVDKETAYSLDSDDFDDFNNDLNNNRVKWFTYDPVTKRASFDGVELPWPRTDFGINLL